ncbi:HIT family protein [Phycicoccus sp. CMS6Z-2]|uniref:HIT family protein n=2 Tax=Phycicoccus flavus TaxID=2502783 RepID=A0A8T6R6S9_9MICO|nr:HIT family protein [Phycicoccus flavus]
MGNHRSAEQLAEMERLAEAGLCLFCPGQLEATGANPVLHRTPHWTVTRNRYPYRGTRLHLLLVPTVHVTDLTDLPADAQADFWDVLAWARAEYDLAFYGLGARNGDPTYTGGTISHLHLHLVVGDVEDPDHEPVRMKLSSRAD